MLKEYAPPADLPEDCLSLFTDGSAMYDKAWGSDSGVTVTVIMGLEIP